MRLRLSPRSKYARRTVTFAPLAHPHAMPCGPVHLRWAGGPSRRCELQGGEGLGSRFEGRTVLFSHWPRFGPDVLGTKTGVTSPECASIWCHITFLKNFRRPAVRLVGLALGASLEGGCLSKGKGKVPGRSLRPSVMLPFIPCSVPSSWPGHTHPSAEDLLMSPMGVEPETSSSGVRCMTAEQRDLVRVGCLGSRHQGPRSPRVADGPSRLKQFACGNPQTTAYTQKHQRAHLLSRDGRPATHTHTHTHT